MNRSLWRSIAALAVLCLLPLTACQARAGAAAFVGSTRISDNRVQNLTAEGLRDPAVRTGVTDISAYRGQVLSRLIRHVLITKAATKLGVSVDDGEVTAALTDQEQKAGGAKKLAAAVAAEPLGLPASQLKDFFRDLILTDKVSAQIGKGIVITDAELKEFYDANGGAEAGTFAALKSRVVELVQQQRLDQERTKYFTALLRQDPVKVNPRYGRFDLSKLFDPQLGPVLKPATDDFLPGAPPKAQPSAPPTQ